MSEAEEQRDASFLKFNYLLRPSKQVERKLFIEALHRLPLGGFDLKVYRYVGFGSVYYADFVLFHKYLFIDEMVCVEAEPIPRRMGFNKPFDFISVEMKTFAELLPELDRTRRHIVWLDYDYPLDADILRDVEGCLHVLPAESILLVTVDAQPRIEFEEGDDDCTQREIVDRTVRRFEEELGRYYPGGVERSVFSSNALPKCFATVLRNKINEVVSKEGREFVHMFNLRYADGAQMLTVGGMIGDAAVRERVTASGVFELEFVGDFEDPVVVSVPPLTIREKHWLDQNLRTGAEVALEVTEEMVASYRRYYRHYPTYYETLT